MVYVFIILKIKPFENSLRLKTEKSKLHLKLTLVKQNFACARVLAKHKDQVTQVRTARLGYKTVVPNNHFIVHLRQIKVLL